MALKLQHEAGGLNGYVFSVMKNGCVCDGNGRPIGTIADKKYMALRRAAQEVIASKKGRF